MNTRILYIEDEDDYQLLVKRILARAGLEVETASTGAEGRAAWLACRPDLLILDINLPDTDGYEICRQLRADPSTAELPVLMLTVRRRPEEWLRGFSSGATDYISKPLNPPELVERVVACLEGTVRRTADAPSPEYRLIQAARAGNRGAFSTMIERYRQRLTLNLLPALKNDEEIEEIVSRTLALAFERMAQFRGEASFYTWLYRIAINEVHAMRRRSTTLSLDGLTGENGEAHPVDALIDRSDRGEVLADEELRRKAAEALDRVTGTHRKILELYFVNDLSYEQISARLKMPMGTVMSRLHRARKLLQAAWNDPQPAARG